MKKAQLLLLIFLCSIGVINAQYSLHVYKSGSIIYSELTTEIDSVKFMSHDSSLDSISILKSGIVKYKRAINEIDSITFENTIINRNNIVETISQDKKFTLFYKALKLTNLTDSLLMMADANYSPDNYESLVNPPFVQGGGSINQLPESRKYGYTVLLESDSTFRNYGISTIEDLRAKAKELYDPVYPEDAGVTDISNSKNSLNRFIAYHLINKRLSYSKFINDYDTPHMINTYDMYEYIETMCPNALIEVRKVRTEALDANFFNMASRPGETPNKTNAIQIVSTNKDNDATNGVYHEIDKILAYNETVASYMSSIRLRMDAASFFPELTNNNMRGYLGDKATDVKSWVIPNGYLNRLTKSEATKVDYLNAYGGYLDFQGDEMSFMGLYDFTITTPAIPAGTYEIRFGYSPTGGRGVAEVYVDDVPVDAPIDFSISATNPEISYVVPGSDSNDPYGYENDKVMRNHGYMKGPASYKDVLGIWYGKSIARNSRQVLRKVLGIFSFNTAGRHNISVKALQEGQFQLDYIEFVPVEVLEDEDVN